MVEKCSYCQKVHETDAQDWQGTVVKVCPEYPDDGTMLGFNPKEFGALEDDIIE